MLHLVLLNARPFSLASSIRLSKFLSCSFSFIQNTIASSEMLIAPEHLSALFRSFGSRQILSFSLLLQLYARLLIYLVASCTFLFSSILSSLYFLFSFVCIRHFRQISMTGTPDGLVWVCFSQAFDVWYWFGLPFLTM